MTLDRMLTYHLVTVGSASIRARDSNGTWVMKTMLVDDPVVVMEF